MNKLDEAIQSILKRFGPEAIISDQSKINVESIPTGSPAIDKASGIGGFPMKRIIEVSGLESSGKTTLACHVLKGVQDRYQDDAVGFIDLEQTASRPYLEKIGVDLSPSRWVFSQPESGEMAFSIIREIIRSEKVRAIALDSVAEVISEREQESDDNAANIGAHARFMSAALKTVVPLLTTYNWMLILINQQRQKPGQLGDPTYTTGGLAIRQRSSMRIRLMSIKKSSDGKYNDVVARFDKNKLASPHKTANFRIVYGEGVDTAYDLADICVEVGIIIKKGNFYYNKKEELVARGKNDLIRWIRSRPKAQKQILKLHRIQLTEKENE